MTQEWSLLTPLGVDFRLWGWSILSSYIGFKLRQVRVDFGPTEVVFGHWESILGVDSVLRSGSRLWTSKSKLWASCSQFFGPLGVVGVEFRPSKVNLGHLEVYFWSVVGGFGLC